MKNKLILLIVLFSLTGCANYQELNDMALTSAIGIDKALDGYQLTAQIINTQNNKNTNSITSQITIYTSEGQTIQEALRLMLLESPKRLFIEHLNILVISEDVAKDGIKDILDFFFRDAESLNQFYVLVARDYTALDILKIITPLESISSSNIKDRLTTDNKYLGITELVTFEELINMYLNNNIEIAIPSITIKGNVNEGDKNQNIEESESEARIFLSNTAIFKDDKLLDYLEQEEDIALNFITNKLQNTIITYKCDDDSYATIEIIGAKTKIKTNKNNLEITIEVSGRGNISEIHCPINLEDPEDIRKIQNDTNNKVISMLENTINNIKYNYNSDIFGFKDSFYKNNNKFYQQIKDNWYNQIFKNLKINIKSNIKITEKGKITKVIKDE